MIDVLARVGFAFAADLRRAGILAARLAQLLHHLEFNRQPVTIPARHIRHILTAHGLEFQDGILENLVERRADVHIAVGKRRPVVQHEGLLGLRVALPNAGVQILRIPLLKPLRLTLHQAGFHGKTGLRQVQRIFVTHARQRRGRYQSRGSVSMKRQFNALDPQQANLPFHTAGKSR